MSKTAKCSQKSGWVSFLCKHKSAPNSGTGKASEVPVQCSVHVSELAFRELHYLCAYTCTWHIDVLYMNMYVHVHVRYMYTYTVLHNSKPAQVVRMAPARDNFRLVYFRVRLLILKNVD